MKTITIQITMMNCDDMDVTKFVKSVKDPAFKMGAARFLRGEVVGSKSKHPKTSQTDVTFWQLTEQKEKYNV